MQTLPLDFHLLPSILATDEFVLAFLDDDDGLVYFRDDY